MRSPRRRELASTCAAAALVLTLSAPHARAGAPEEAEALIARGIELREQGKDDEALDVFREAHAKSPSARGRAQIALAEQALGMWAAAEADLLAALASPSDPWIAKNRAALDGALSVIRRHVGSLEVRGAESAEVLLDGVRLGSGAGPYRVEAGRRALEVRAKGFRTTSRSVEIPAGGVARETVQLVASGAEEEPKAPVSAGAAPRDGAGAAEVEPGSGQRLLGWGFVGVGAALVTTGAVGLFVRQGIVDDYNTRCPGLGVAQPADCDEKVDSARMWLTVSIVTLVAGGVSAAAGAVLVLTAPKGGTRAALSCSPTAGHATGVACAASF